MHKPPYDLIRKRQGYASEPLRKLLIFFTPLRWIQLAFFLVILVLCQNFSRSAWLQAVDNKVYDQFLRAQSSPKISPVIVHIGIDRKSLESIKPFPWPKRYYAAMGRVLREWGAKAVVFNQFFLQAGDTTEDNQALLEEFKKDEHLYLPVSFESEGLRNYYYVNQSDPAFTELAKGLGHINYNQDPDGLVRRIFPFVKFNQKFIPHLGLLVAYDYLGKKLAEPKDCDFPRDRNNNLLIHWARRWSDASGYYPFSEVLNSYALRAKGQPAPIRPEDFKGKICLVGFTIADFKATPLDAATPSIGVLSNIINTVLTGEFIRLPSPGTSFFLLLILAVFAALLFLPFRNILLAAGGLALAGAWIVFAFLVFSKARLWLGVATPVLLILFYFFVSLAIARISEYRERLYFLNLAARDELTGLYAMRYVSTFLPQLMNYAHTFKKPFSVVLLDIDDFRKVNDTYGYRNGNMVLKKVADIITGSIRTKHRAVPDVAGRYGDEEFIVLLAGYNLAEATFGIAERIRKGIAQSGFQASGQTFKVTASAGIGVLKDGEKNPANVIERAQEALLKAKASGKNQTCISD